MIFFDDIRIGDRFVYATHEVTADKIKDFAAKYDPQPFHLDEAAAAASHFGGLCASGWLTGSLWIRSFVDYWTAERARRAGNGETLAEMGPSPGFEEMVWHRPVYAGDRITFAAEVGAKRLLASRPGWGLVTQENSAVNQNGDRVMSFKGKVFLQCRPDPDA